MAADMVGWPVIVSDVLPMLPTPGQYAWRMVRHGLAEWVEYIGEDVGLAPDAALHALFVDGALHVSAAAFEQLRAAHG